MTFSMVSSRQPIHLFPKRHWENSGWLWWSRMLPEAFTMPLQLLPWMPCGVLTEVWLTPWSENCVRQFTKWHPDSWTACHVYFSDFLFSSEKRLVEKGHRIWSERICFQHPHHMVFGSWRISLCAGWEGARSMDLQPSWGADELRSSIARNPYIGQYSSAWAWIDDSSLRCVYVWSNFWEWHAWCLVRGSLPKWPSFRLVKLRYIYICIDNTT